MSAGLPGTAAAELVVFAKAPLLGRVKSRLAAGIGEEDRQPAQAEAADGAWAAALRYAQRKRIGPFAPAAPDRLGRERAFAAMIRAGHQIDYVRRVLDTPPGEIPNADTM